MALEFPTPIITVQGFSVDNAYGRVSVVDNPSGNSITISCRVFCK